jgi:thermitase
MYKFGRHFAVAIAITMMFLANIVNVAFSPIILTKAESTKEFSADKGSTLTSTQPDSGFYSSSKEMDNGKPESSFQNLWGLDAFNKDTHFDGIKERSGFAYFDEDSAELVIGVNNAKRDAYAKLVDEISRSQGRNVNTVSIEGEVIAVVADMPLTAISSFTEKVQKIGLARYIEPNMKFQTQFVPNDPYWSLQWGPQKIEADWAWNTTTGDSSILVAVIDTGIDYDHPDLEDNYVPLGRDWVNNDEDPLDDNGHGTHCAGIVAAVSNNTVGIAGIANVSIMVEKGLDDYGWGPEDGLAKAIIHAVDQGADILSNSWGDYGESYLIRDAVQYAYDKGVLVIAAAGNEAISDKLYPAAYEEVVAVTATDSYDYPAWFTNFGDWIEVAAPGVDIYSTMPTYHVTLNDHGYNQTYDYLKGTSMACPHVAGVAALIWSQFPNSTRDWVRAQLRYTTDDLGDPGFDDYYGYGRINAREAVEQAPQDHDVLIFDWKKPACIKLGDIASFNVAVLNFGANDEENVTAQLLVDGNLTDSTVIDYLTNGTLTTVSLSWKPLEERTYNVTFYVVPVPDETMTENNVMTKMIPVKSIIGFVLFDQSHDCYPFDWFSMWVGNLTERGYAVDTYTAGTITPGVLAGYDVFVIPEAWDSYSSDEISAIQDFVLDGGGLLVIGDNYPSIYTSLTSFAGITWDYEYYGWSGYTSDITPHDVTGGVTSAYFRVPYSQLFVGSPAIDLIRDGYGYDEIMLAVSEVGAGRVIAIADEDTINDHGITSADNLVLADNMIGWLSGVKYKHELTVRLEAPSYIKPGEASLLNATVYNRGLNNETDVELQLLINDALVSNITIPELVNGTLCTMNYSWTPSVEAVYNITAYAPPVPDENVTRNNMNTKYVHVQYPLIDPVEGQYANYILNYYNSSGFLIGVGYMNFTYEYYIEPRKIYITAWQKDPFGYIYINWMIVNTMTRLVESGNIWTGWWYRGWIETDINIGSTINLMDGTATVNATRMLVVGPRAIDCWEIPYSMYGDPYTFWYDKVSGLWIKMESTISYTAEIELLLIDTNVPIGTQYDHDLGVTLDTPQRLQPDETSLLNATVYNTGLSNETGVELQLLINGTAANETTIPELLTGEFYTISHLWTPTIAGTYNITVYAPSVHDENVTINNVYSKFVPVQYALRILVYVENTDYYQDYANTIKAISFGFGPNYILTQLLDYTQLDSMLPGQDILLIPDQEYASLYDMEMIGVEWAETLAQFLENGGILILCDGRYGYGGTYGILTGAELMSISSANYRSYYTLFLVHPSDLLAEGVSSSFVSPYNTVSFVTEETNVVIEDGYHYPVVIHKEIGRGHIALLGFDFESSNADTEQLLGNAVSLAAYIPISVNPSAGSPGTKVTVTGTNAIANGTISIYWDSTFMGNSTANAVGDFTYLMTVPSEATIGFHEIMAIDIATGRTGSTPFRVILIDLNPTEGPIGTNVTVNGAGFAPKSQVTVTFSDMLIGYAISNSFGNFTFTFNTPLSTAGKYYIEALDAEGNYACKKFTVVDVTPLDVQIDVGAIHFRGEITEFYAQTTFKGQAINATLTNIVLYKPDGTTEDLTAQLVTSGLYKISYTILGNETGTYTLVITASYATDTVQANGTSFKCFLVSDTLTLMNKRVTEVRDGVTMIQTDFGLIRLNLTAMNATLENIYLKVIAINGTTVAIQTTLGMMNGTITSIEGDIATIMVPGVGQIETDISSLKETQETWLILQYAIIIIALIAAASSTLSAVLLRRKKTTKTE